jgi:hypothetical protein
MPPSVRSENGKPIIARVCRNISRNGHGIDLIAFVDLDESGTFMGRPIQMKASSQQMFGVWRKHEKFPDLLLAYIWHVTDPPKTVCYCLTFPQAISVAEQMK